MISKAPARICLFGDHQDYLGLPVIACAIDKYLTVSGNPNQTNLLNFDLIDLNRIRSININSDLSQIEKGDHILFVLKTLKKHGVIINNGYDIKIKSEIFINAGISSSSALIVGLINFFLKIYNPEKVSTKYISELAYEAEVLLQAGSGGKMDQYSISNGNTIFLETGINNSFKKIKSPFKNFIIANSEVKKHTDEILSKLKIKTLDAIKIVCNQYPSLKLCEIKESQVNDFRELIDEEAFKYFKAAIINHSITLDALSEFEKDKPDLMKLGKLMIKHHNVLKNKLCITVPKIDRMIDLAKKNGAYGYKIIGSGGGGSILILAENKFQEKIISDLKKMGVNEIVKSNESPGILDL